MVSNFKIAKLLARGGDLFNVVGILLFSAAYKSRSYGFVQRRKGNRPLPGMLFLVVSLVASVMQIAPFFMPEDKTVSKIVRLHGTFTTQHDASTATSVLNILIQEKQAFQLMLRVLGLVTSLTMCVQHASVLLKGSPIEREDEEEQEGELVDAAKPVEREDEEEHEGGLADAAKPKGSKSAVERAWPSIFLAAAVAMAAATIKACADDGIAGLSVPQSMAELAHLIGECVPSQGGQMQLLQVLAIGPQLQYLDDGFGHGIALRLGACGLLVAAWQVLGEYSSFGTLTGISKIQHVTAVAQVVTIALFFFPNYAKRNVGSIVFLPIHAAVMLGIYVSLSYAVPMLIDSSEQDYPFISQTLSELSIPKVDTFTIDDWHRHLSVLCIVTVLFCVIVGGTTGMVCTLAVGGMLAKAHGITGS